MCHFLVSKVKSQFFKKSKPLKMTHISRKHDLRWQCKSNLSIKILPQNMSALNRHYFFSFRPNRSFMRKRYRFAPIATHFYATWSVCLSFVCLLHSCPHLYKTFDRFVSYLAGTLSLVIHREIYREHDEFAQNECHFDGRKHL